MTVLPVDRAILEHLPGIGDGCLPVIRRVLLNQPGCGKVEG